jgi:hypothetical protein
MVVGAVGPHSDHVIQSALAVFSLAEPFTEKDLSVAYRKVALRCHPDKGGRQDLFETVCECYKTLHSHARAVGMWDDPDVNRTYGSMLDLRGRDDGINTRRSEREDSERVRLRTEEDYNARGIGIGGGGGIGSGGGSGSGIGSGSCGVRPPLPAASGSAFNVAEFNRRYDESRSRNVERDTGYASWMAKAAGEFSEPAKPLINPKSGVGAFNSAFEKHTPHLDSHTGAIILRPAEASAGGLCGALLDDDEEVGDYTTDVGGGVSGADCRLAHGNQRLAARAWAREEVRVDRTSVGRFGAERDADLRRAPDDAPTIRGLGANATASANNRGRGGGGARGGGVGLDRGRDLAAEIGIALSGLRGF